MTEFMKVPAACGLSDDLDELLGTPVGAAIGRSQLSLLQPDAHLALRLLQFKPSLGQVSPWYDYIALLPEHVPLWRATSRTKAYSPAGATTYSSKAWLRATTRLGWGHAEAPCRGKRR